MKKTLIFFALTLFFTSCYTHKSLFVDFSNIENADPSWFKVTSTKCTDLSDGLPSDCILDMDQTKTSSVCASEIIQDILSFGNQNKLIEISGTYPSIDDNGEPINLSGKVILPANGKFKHFIIVSHYTIGAYRESPSVTFPLEGTLAKSGYAVIVPDYLGYGITSDRMHPYLMMNITAKNVLDMYLAVVPFLHAAGCDPDKEPIYLYGFSQGGANTMALLRLIETRYPEIKVKRAFAGGGPYDVKKTYEKYVLDDYARHCCTIPLVLQGMVRGANLDESIIKRVLRPYVVDNLDAWINSKLYTVNEMNELIGTHVSHEILTEEGMDRSSDAVSAIYKAMVENSIMAQSWKPKSPVYMFHSMEDDTVDFSNATSAKSMWKDCNIQYNFGKYGVHRLSCLRFLYSVRKMLSEED